VFGGEIMISCHRSTGLNSVAALCCGGTDSIGVLGFFFFFWIGGGCSGKIFWAAALYEMVVRGGVRDDGGWANCWSLEFWG